MLKYVTLLLLLACMIFEPRLANASSCEVLEEGVHTTFYTGDDGGTICVGIPNSYGASKFEYVAVNSSFYRPTVGHRVSRSGILNIIPKPEVGVNASTIHTRNRDFFSLYVKNSPRKYQNSDRVPHSVTFYVQFHNGIPIVLISTDMLTKESINDVQSQNSLGSLDMFEGEQIWPRGDTSVLLNSLSDSEREKKLRGEGAECNSENRSPNQVPPTANLNRNIYVAKRLNVIADRFPIVVRDAIKFSWFYHQVRNGARWDYKQLDTTAYEKFGNYNYGAVGRALGIDREILLRAAGWAQTRAGTTDESWGHYLGEAPYGDDPADAKWVTRGMNYTDEVVKDLSASELDSLSTENRDSCNSRHAKDQRKERDMFMDTEAPGVFIHRLDTRGLNVVHCYVFQCRRPTVTITDLNGR